MERRILHTSLAILLNISVLVTGPSDAHHGDELGSMRYLIWGDSHEPKEDKT